MLLEERFPSHSFTEIFVERLLAAVSAVPSREAGGLSADRAPLALQALIPGGPRAIRPTLDCLEALGIIATVDGGLARTKLGNTIRRQLRAEKTSGAVALAVIRSGFMGDQVRTLRETLELSEDGYRCTRHRARDAAPQLLGLLARLPDVVIANQISIGPETSRELDSLWNEVLPSSRINWADLERRRKAVGDRAESYSMEFERARRVGAVGDVAWVSRDDDGLGYDIEVAGTPTRRIEVKGSAGPDVIFYLTAREHEVAARFGAAYEVQFWGTVDLRSDPRVDYERLRTAGYPIRIVAPLTALRGEPWSMIPDRYKVSTSVRVGAPELQPFAVREVVQ